MSENQVCEVCGSSRHAQAYCCSACKKLLDRIDIRRSFDREARRRALKFAWDGSCFRCYYTGWALSTTDQSSPIYLTWEHLTPGDETNVVVAAACVNDMKSDLTDEEFRSLVIQLARRFQSPNYEIPPPILTKWRRHSSISRNAVPGISIPETP